MELKNLTRQNFVAQDIGKNKAEVLAARYSSAYDVEINFIPEFLPKDIKEAQQMITDIAEMDSPNRNNIVLVGCVDNSATRHVMHNIYRNRSNLGYSIIAYIDSGNEFSAGQVVFSSKITFLFSSIMNITIPDIIEKFDLPNTDKHPSEESCAEHAISAPQDITTNIFASTILLNYCSILAYNTSVVAKAMRIGTWNRSTDDRIAIIKGLRTISNNVTYFDAFSNQTSKAFVERISSEINSERWNEWKNYRPNPTTERRP